MDAFEDRLENFLHEFRELVYKHQIFIGSGEELRVIDLDRMYKKGGREEIDLYLSHFFENLRGDSLSTEKYYRKLDEETKAYYESQGA